MGLQTKRFTTGAGVALAALLGVVSWAILFLVALAMVTR